MTFNEGDTVSEDDFMAVLAARASMSLMTTGLFESVTIDLGWGFPFKARMVPKGQNGIVAGRHRDGAGRHVEGNGV